MNPGLTCTETQPIFQVQGGFFVPALCRADSMCGGETGARGDKQPATTMPAMK